MTVLENTKRKTSRPLWGPSGQLESPVGAPALLFAATLQGACEGGNYRKMALCRDTIPCKLVFCEKAVPVDEGTKGSLDDACLKNTKKEKTGRKRKKG